jgi:hypothetical protein
MLRFSDTASSIRKPRSHRRPNIARKPAWDCLDKRELLSTLILPASNGSTFTGSTPNLYGPGVDSGQTFYGGDYLGMLNGTTALSTYSVDDSSPAIVPGQYNAAVTTNGTTFGASVPNAGAIAWLLTNIAPTVQNADQQAALQAAIWRVEYGTNLSAGGFQLDGADNTNDPGDNDAALIADYKADIAALGSHTAPVSSVDWISPSDSYGNNYQSLVALPVGQVETLTLPNTNVPEFSYQYVDTSSGETIPTSGSAGNFLGTLGTTRLVATYCVAINLGISSGATYGATVANGPQVFNEAVPNAGAIAWLLTNFGPTATSADQQNALQAAIWREEYGAADFQLIPGNDATLVADYNADLAALGSHTAPTNSVFWLSPYDTNDSNPDQGLVAIAASIPVKYATKAVVTSTLGSAAYGRPVTFDATVANVTSPSGPRPTGSVQFQINGANFGSPVPLSSHGTAAISESTLGIGSYSIDAVYIPTGNFTTITSQSYRQAITRDITHVFVSASANPTIKNKSMNFYVTIRNESAGSTAVALGTVVFKIDSRIRGTFRLSGGKAALTGIKLSTGTHTVTVFYTPANADFAASSGSLLGGEKVH